MFRILDGRSRPRAVSPMTIAVSVSAHFLVLCGVVYAAASRPEEEVVIEIPIDRFPRIVQPEQPKQPDPAPARAAAPASRQPAAASQQVLRPPTETPHVIASPDPRALPLTIRDLEPRGPVGPSTGPGGDPNPGGADPTPFGPVPDYVPSADDVDERPQVDRDGLARLLSRYYPRNLQDARVTGRVLVEMIVDEEGRVVDGSARVLETSHPAFAEATLRAVERFRFTPARMAGMPVAVRVTIPIAWTLAD